MQAHQFAKFYIVCKALISSSFLPVSKQWVSDCPSSGHAPFLASRRWSKLTDEIRVINQTGKGHVISRGKTTSGGRTTVLALRPDRPTWLWSGETMGAGKMLSEITWIIISLSCQSVMYVVNSIGRQDQTVWIDSRIKPCIFTVVSAPAVDWRFYFDW